MLLAYAGMNVLYSLILKHVVILDVFTIAAGFVLRVFAGGLIVQVEPSSWLIMATFLLSLFLALAKRRHELLLMKQIANSHRPVLEQYSVTLVDILTAVVTPVTLITYILYTLDGTTMARFHSSKLYLTSGFVVFGIFRYLYLIHQKIWVALQPNWLSRIHPCARPFSLGSSRLQLLSTSVNENGLSCRGV